jgi:hypothetical protein
MSKVKEQITKMEKKLGLKFHNVTNFNDPIYDIEDIEDIWVQLGEYLYFGEGGIIFKYKVSYQVNDEKLSFTKTRIPTDYYFNSETNMMCKIIK